MADENITPKRGRGRPRKQEKTSAPAVETVPATVDDLDEERMQEQIKENLKSLLKLAAKRGISIEDLFDAPPADTTVVEETAEVNASIDEELGVQPDWDVRRGEVPMSKKKQKKLAKLMAQARPQELKPGGAIFDENGRAQYIKPWTRNDLQTSKRIKFIPRPIPTMVYPLHDMYGLQKIKLDVNGLVCWLTCGVENEVYEFFYNAYLDGEKSYSELERFKAHGPDAAPWGAVGPDGRPAWRFTPQALTFGMDPDGKYLIDSPLYERAAAPTETEE